MFRVLFLFLFPIFSFAASGSSDIFRLGTASIDINSNSVDGTLFGYKRHINDGTTTFAADINYILVKDNNYGIDDTTEFMLHLGAMFTDSLELYGSLGYAKEGSAGGFGWGGGLNYAISDEVSITYEYREFDMEDNSYDYTLKSSSLGLLISF